MLRWLCLELLILRRSSATVFGMLGLLACGVAAIGHGRALIDQQRASVDAASERQLHEHQRVLAPLPPSANAADQLFYLAFHTVRQPAAWAPVALGQRDVQAFNLKIRVTALQGQLYDTDVASPLLASFGHFDLAFVFVVLAPLFVIALTYNVHSGEVEAGTWSLLRSQPVPAWRILAAKALLRAASVWLPLIVLQLLATAWLRLPLDATWVAVAGGGLAYVVVWTATCLLVAMWRRPSDVNVLVLLGVWVAWTALGPALLNVAAAVRFPMPEAMELTVLQRQAYHGAWDEPLPDVMAAFVERYPEWKNAAVPRDRYSNAWYYAMQQRGDDAAAPAAARYRQQLESRDRWMARWAWLFPPAAFQRALARTARTDLRAYLAYLDSVAAYHERLKRHFLPVIFAESPISAVDWTAVPRHAHRD